MQECGVSVHTLVRKYADNSGRPSYPELKRLTSRELNHKINLQNKHLHQINNFYSHIEQTTKRGK
jgi:hypothetical protein